MKMRIIELFGGIGACSKALNRIGQEVEIVDYVEIDKYAVASYNAINRTNFGSQDIKEWDKDFKDIDLIMHGSPCQDFSVAGKQAGGDIGSGTRSSLMYETIRIVGKIRPKYVIWENVKNLLSKKHKHNFDNYIQTMQNLGYRSYYKVLDAKDYGIPQHRERIFTVSIRNDIDKDFCFPEKEPLTIRLKDLLEKEVEDKYYLNDKQIKRIETTTYNTGKTRIQKKDYCDTLCARDWKDPKCIQVGNTEPKVLIKNATKKGYIEAVEGDSVNLAYPESTTRRGRVGNQVAQTLQCNDNMGVIQKVDIKQKVKVRKYPVNTEKLCETLRNAKVDNDINNKQLEILLNVPLTTVEHWFRKDNCFAIPAPEIWFKLKEILNINTNEFDESIMTFEEKDGVYEKANRCYLAEGIAPTLTLQEEKIITDLRIRKLTPKECWRLMGFDDEDFEKAKSVPTSNSQLYKQAGNSIVVNVLEEIFKQLL